ncbi:SGNH hydrolase domain-containing protein [Pelagibacterium lentulum]|uniref:SGNH hydrolase domain-containing protein n=1 Tax=Pelagibacterium lentulum TaxID=2029865 RepID=UPI0035317245
MNCVFARSSLLRASCGPDALVLPKSAYDARNADLNEVFAKLARERIDASAIFPGTTMCASGTCLTEINGEFLFRDNSHIRRNLSAGTLEVIANTIGLRDVLN